MFAFLLSRISHIAFNRCHSWVDQRIVLLDIRRVIPIQSPSAHQLQLYSCQNLLEEWLFLDRGLEFEYQLLRLILASLFLIWTFWLQMFQHLLQTCIQMNFYFLHLMDNQAIHSCFQSMVLSWNHSRQQSWFLLLENWLGFKEGRIVPFHLDR